MKRLFIFIIALAMSLGINAQTYQQLWYEFNKDIDNLLPESAEKVLNKIENKAFKDNNDVQLLKTAIKRCEILNMRDENPKDTIVNFCKSFLPMLSEKSQLIMKIEIARFDYKYDDILKYKDNDYIKTVNMEEFEDIFMDKKSDQAVFDINLEPTLYDYVMHYLIKYYKYNSLEDELYDKLLDFDLKNNYIKAYYNNRMERIGELYTKDDFDKYAQLAEDCTDNEFIAKIKIKQIKYLTNMNYERRIDEKAYVKAKKLCDEAMTLLDKKHPLYKQCIEFNKSITQKTILARIDDVSIPGKPIAVGLYYRNTTNPSYKIFKVSSSEFRTLRSQNDEKYYRELLTKKAEVTNTVQTTEEDDYEEHSSLIALPALQCGLYYLVFSNNDSFNKYDDLIFLPFQVSNLAYFTLKTDDHLNVYVVNRETGEPMNNVKANLSKRVYNYTTKEYYQENIGHAVSDKNGFLVGPNIFDARFYVDLYYNKDTLVSNDVMDFYRTTVDDKVTITTNFYTDRGIYRPGQTVHFRGLMIKKTGQKNEVLPNYELVVSLYDPNYQVIDTLHVKSNDFGAFTGSFNIPTDIINGQFQIKHKYDGISFRVEEYKRPTFEVSFNTPEQEYRIGDSITVTGKVAALSGFGLDNVNYKYTIIRKTFFPYRYWGWVPYPVEDVTIVTSRGTTADDGSFNIKFKLEPSRDIPIYDMPRHTYMITVEATSKQGETQRESYSVYATYNKYDIRIENSGTHSISENATTVDVSELKDMFITVANINGKPSSSKIECKIFKINDKERYSRDLGHFDRQLLDDETLKAYFPYYDYYSQDHESKDLVYQNVVNVNGKARLLPDTEKLKPARYIVELKSIDDSLSVYGNEYIICDVKAKKMPYKAMYWTTIDKNTAKPGETINYYIGSSEKNVSALVIVKLGKKIIKTERITLNNSIYKLSYKVREEDRGRLDFQVALVKHNIEKRHVTYVNVPFDNMDLHIELHTERDKMLPGEKETWSVTVKDYKNKPVSASLMATMYDAALDNFVIHDWHLNTKPSLLTNSLIMSDKTFVSHYKYQYFDIYSFYLERFQMFSNIRLLPYVDEYRYYMKYAETGAILNRSAIDEKVSFIQDSEAMEEVAAPQAVDEESNNKQAESRQNTTAKVRKDFSETAFFYPDMRTDDNGNVTFNFTMPDALTRWNLMLLTYDKSLNVGKLEKTFVTQQPVMIMADMPRFVYDEDTLWFAANVINLSDNEITPTVKLEIFDENNRPVDLILSETEMKTEAIPVGLSRCVKWKVALQKDVNPLIFRFSAYSDNFSDAEQHMLPVLSTDIFMTQTFSLTAKANTTQNYDFDMNNDGERNQVIRLNFSVNPIWYAIQALPYLIEGNELYATSAFNRYFTNTMAQQILEKNPKIKDMIKDNKDDTLSELQKNSELKAILLKETPWVLDAHYEARQRANVSKLLDKSEINKNIASALDLLTEKQTQNGGWPWIQGMPESEYITQYILCGMGRLGKSNDMTEKAFHYIENQIVNRYKELDTPKKKKKAGCTFITMKDLFAMSYFSYKTSKDFDEAKTFYIKKLYNDWKFFSPVEQAHIALLLNRNGYEETAHLIIKSLRQRAIKNELGMYWRGTGVESQARILEAFNEIEPKIEEIDDMRLWILTQKCTNMWDNDRGTVEAVFALMNRGTDWTDSKVTLHIDKETINLSDRVFYTQDVEPQSVTSLPISIENKTHHVIWGGLFRQYFVPIDKVKKHNDAMKITRELFVERIVDGKKQYVPISEESIKVGDKIKVEITFENNQIMEYVYLKDLRGACFEPTEQLSRYHWDNGLWYYQSTTDVSMEFFFEHLSKGKHTLSHTMYVTKEGNFSAGYSLIQCQYAPEFGAYSNGSRISVNP